MENKIVDLYNKYGMLFVLGGIAFLLYSANKAAPPSSSSGPAGAIGVRG